MSLDLAALETKFESAYQTAAGEIRKIHTGRANSALIEDIKVEAYEGSQPLKIIELGTISIPEPQLLVIQLFDPQIADKVSRAILEANIGLTPTAAGGTIRINIPPLSQERRQELVRVVKQRVEDGKVLIRQLRHEAMNQIKADYEAKQISEDEAKQLETQVQELVDKYNQKLDDLFQAKEADIIKV